MKTLAPSAGVFTCTGDQNEVLDWTGLALASAAAMLAACGGGSDPGGNTDVDLSGARGSLMYNPPLQVTAMSAADFTARLQGGGTSGQTLLAVAGAPKCDVSFRYFEYGTVGGAGEATNASGALMVPSGTAAGCSGPRPIVLYAHGTTTDRGYNIADITNPARPGASEGTLLAAMFAAQGFIVVAPNYAGYDVSTLGYHPYLNADQQSKDMIDALTAARKALPATGGEDSGKLFITGYSQGGHVAMATHRALQAAGQRVTASAPMSGPYAMGAFGDAIYYGNVDLGATVFAPMLATSYQKAYGNIYTQPSDLFEAAYAPGSTRCCHPPRPWTSSLPRASCRKPSSSATWLRRPGSKPSRPRPSRRSWRRCLRWASAAAT